MAIIVDDRAREWLFSRLSRGRDTMLVKSRP